MSADSDGPVEWCWPIPDDQADAIAASLPDLTLRTEPAHQEACVHPETPGQWGSGTQAELAIEALAAWVTQQQRQPSGGIRLLFVPNPASKGTAPDSEFALPLRCHGLQTHTLTTRPAGTRHKGIRGPASCT